MNNKSYESTVFRTLENINRKKRCNNFKIRNIRSRTKIQPLLKNNLNLINIFTTETIKSRKINAALSVYGKKPSITTYHKERVTAWNSQMINPTTGSSLYVDYGPGVREFESMTNAPMRSITNALVGLTKLRKPIFLF